MILLVGADCEELFLIFVCGKVFNRHQKPVISEKERNQVMERVWFIVSTVVIVRASALERRLSLRELTSEAVRSNPEIVAG